MRLTSIYILFSLLLITACGKDPDPVKDPTPYELKIPYRFPTLTNIPADNPMTVEGIELGRYLFFDERLNGRTHPDSALSCASCHKPEYAFDFSPGKPKGIYGQEMARTSMPLMNLAWTQTGFRWNGDTKTLEEDVFNVIHNPIQFDNTPARVAAIIASIPIYPPMFVAAFGDANVTPDRIAKAISQFLRSLVSANSKFDRYLRSEVNLDPAELRGYVLFTTEKGDCFHCHGEAGNPLFTTNLFYNNAKDIVFNDPDDRYAVSGKQEDIGAYKAPSLRNLLFTSPYMHDGRFQTLEQVIDFYSEGLKWSPYASPLMKHAHDGGLMLNPSQKADLLAFLKALSDSSFVTNPKHQDPFR
jgi:cytochrome c peroxidase